MRLYSLNANVASALRMGDIDADTYPDLLLTLYDPSSNKAYPKSFLFKNQECSEEFCQNLTHKRYFKYGDNDFNNILEEANMTMFATFMDIGEMGLLILYLRKI